MINRAFAGDRRVWRVAAALATVLLACTAVAVVAVPRDYYTGTNSVRARSIVASVSGGQHLCVPGMRIPPGTGRIELSLASPGARTPPFHLTVRARGLRTAATVAGATGALHKADASVSGLPRSGGPLTGEVCITPLRGAIRFGGMVGLGAGQVSPTLDGHPLGSRVAVWFRPPRGERKTIAELLPEMLPRAALFRAPWVGPWTYVVLLVLTPLLGILAVRTLALAVAGEGRRRMAIVALAAIAFANAAAWGLVTPAFDAPDEPDHFAYTQLLAETGRAPAQVAGSRPALSSAEMTAVTGVRLYSEIERSDGRPPWLREDERAWDRRVRAAGRSLRRDDGGGHTTSATHAPLYYLAVAPAYLAAGTSSPFTQLWLMRLVSAFLAAVTVACAYLLVRELLPKQEQYAVAATALVAFQPMFTFMGGAVNNDNGVNALCAAALLLAVRALRRGLTPTLAVGLGFVLALAPVAKGTGLAIYPAALVALAGTAWRWRRSPALRSWPILAGAFAATTLAWSAVSGLIDRVQQTGGTPSIAAVTSSDVASGALHTVLDSPGLFLSYSWQVFLPRLPFMTDLAVQQWPAFDIYIVRGFAAFGWYSVMFPRWIYVLVVAVVLAISALGVWALWRRRAALRRGWWLEVAVLLAAVVGVLAAVEAAFAAVATRPVVAEQGRYAFTAITAFAALAVGAGLGLPSRRRDGYLTVIVVLMIGFAVASQWLAFATFYS